VSLNRANKKHIPTLSWIVSILPDEPGPFRNHLSLVQVGYTEVEFTLDLLPF